MLHGSRIGFQGTLRRAIALPFAGASVVIEPYRDVLVALRLVDHLPERTVAVVHELMEARDERRLLRLQKQMANQKLLIIDELGFEPMDRSEASLFFRLVTYRYGRGSILITTNKSVRDWSELLAGDEALTAAILDRLLHNAHVINIKGRSYRLRDLEQTLGARQG